MELVVGVWGHRRRPHVECEHAVFDDILVPEHIARKGRLLAAGIGGTDSRRLVCCRDHKVVSAGLMNCHL